MQKDFSIQEEAGGVGKAIIKNFTAIVTGNALEIRFYWAGKGTTGLPVRGVYGPLISAISVTHGKLRKFYELNHQDSVRTVQNHQCSLVLSNLCTLSIHMTNKSGVIVQICRSYYYWNLGGAFSNSHEAKWKAFVLYLFVLLYYKI